MKIKITLIILLFVIFSYLCSSPYHPEYRGGKFSIYLVKDRNINIEEAEKMDLDDQNNDAAILQQEDNIKKEIAQSQEIVSQIRKIEVLSEYLIYPAFKSKLNDLCKIYNNVRQVRGDGNCFYRCYAVAILEYINRDDMKEERSKLNGVIVNSKEFLINQGICY